VEKKCCILGTPVFSLLILSMQACTTFFASFKQSFYRTAPAVSDLFYFQLYLSLLKSNLTTNIYRPGIIDYAEATLEILTGIPTPIVDEIETFLRYFPLLADGFAFSIAFITVLALSISLSLSKDALPMDT